MEAQSEDGDAMKRVGPGDVGFEKILQEHQIIMPWVDVQRRHDGTGDLAAGRERLRQPRAAGEPIPRTADDFHQFTMASYTPNQGSVMGDVFPIMKGPCAYTGIKDLDCSHFASMTSGRATPPRPSYLEGASMKDVHPVVARELAPLIVPSAEHQLMPVAPNLAVTVASGADCIRTAVHQACLAGAHCARALHALDRWGRPADEASPFDGRAVAYSAVYQDYVGALEVYSHRVEVAAGGRPRYRMTKLDTALLLVDEGKLHRGVTAFRNLRDLAAERRDAILKAADARAVRRYGAPSQYDP